MEALRRKLVYELFIEQFMEMSKTSLDFRALNQSLIYLKQAERICLLMIDDQHPEEAAKFSNEIEPLKRNIQNMINDSSQGPELPRRDSDIEKERSKVRYRPQKVVNEDIYCNVEKLRCAAANLEEFCSDDDNDDIYTYDKAKRSTKAVVHRNSSRFNQIASLTSSMESTSLQSKDEPDDGIEVDITSL